MVLWLVIDGYNVINEWSEFKDLKKTNLHVARTRLIEIMQEFSPLLWHRIIIVFDAYKTTSEKDNYEKYENVEVVYTKEGLTADSYIERLVSQFAEPGIIIEVASSDYLEQRLIFWKGGKRIPSRELKARLQACKEELVQEICRKHPPPRSTVSGFLPEKTRLKLEKWRKGPVKNP